MAVPAGGSPGDVADRGCGCETAAEQQVIVGVPDGGVELGEAIEQQAGTTGFGAATPAMSEPRPSFWSVGASSLPFASRLFADWNFCNAATVFESSLPLGSP